MAVAMMPLPRESEADEMAPMAGERSHISDALAQLATDAGRATGACMGAECLDGEEGAIEAGAPSDAEVPEGVIVLPSPEPDPRLDQLRAETQPEYAEFLRALEEFSEAHHPLTIAPAEPPRPFVAAGQGSGRHGRGAAGRAQASSKKDQLVRMPFYVAWRGLLRHYAFSTAEAIARLQDHPFFQTARWTETPGPLYRTFCEAFAGTKIRRVMVRRVDLERLKRSRILRRVALRPRETAASEALQPEPQAGARIVPQSPLPTGTKPWYAPCLNRNRLTLDPATAELWRKRAEALLVWLQEPVYLTPRDANGRRDLAQK
jgi:hypothetical protein